MVTLHFVDKNKNLAMINMKLEDSISFTGEVNSCYGQIRDYVEPASLGQERILDLQRRYHLKEYNKEVWGDITSVITPFVAERNKRETEFVKEYVRNKLWWYLYSYYKGSYKLCMRIEATFKAMNWPYHFAEQVDIKEDGFDAIEIAGIKFYCDKESKMERFFRRHKPSLSKFKFKIDGDQIELGFADWCANNYPDTDWSKRLDRGDGFWKESYVEDVSFWVGK